MTLFEDTRNQEGKHKNIGTYCKRNGITLERRCLLVGDYMLPGGRVSIDTKQDMMELCKDIMSGDHRRFRDECIRAQEAGIQLVILVEEEMPYGKVDYWQVPIWKSSGKYHKYGDPMTRVEPKALKKAMRTMVERYGVMFEFCSKANTPRRIIDILTKGK